MWCFSRQNARTTWMQVKEHIYIHIYSKMGYDMLLFSWSVFFFIYNFFLFSTKKSYPVPYSVYVQYDDFYATFVNRKKNIYMWILRHTVMCTINICFSISIFSIFYQKIIFHDIQCYVQCDNVYSTFVNGKNLHVNIVTYSDVYNKRFD